MVDLIICLILFAINESVQTCLRAGKWGWINMFRFSDDLEEESVIFKVVQWG